MADHHELSPSAFPAWSQCPRFDSDSTQRDDAAAGTRNHAALAAALQGHSALLDALPLDARDGVVWAADYVRANSGAGAMLETERRVRLLNDAGAEVYFGTADVVAITMADGVHLFDFKSGDDSKDHKPQMAGYSLALFDGLFDADTITAHLLYGRIKRAVVHTFTRESSAAIVMPILEARKNPSRQPAACDWCGLCAHRLTCPALVDRAMAVAKVRDWQGDLPALAHPSVITDPALMGRALALARFVGDWVDSVRHHATEMAKSGAALPGFRLQERRGARGVEDLTAAFERIGLEPPDFLKACKLSIPKLGEIVAEVRGMKKAAATREVEDRLAGLVTEAAPSFSLVADRQKDGES